MSLTNRKQRGEKCKIISYAHTKCAVDNGNKDSFPQSCTRKYLAHEGPSHLEKFERNKCKHILKCSHL